MPSFYPFELSQKMPLTPPEIYETFVESSIGTGRQSKQGAGQVFRPSPFGSYGFDHQPLIKSSGPMMIPLQHITSGRGKRGDNTNEAISSSHPTAFSRKPSNIPMLPSIHIARRTPTENVSLQPIPPVPETRLNEERATGGVAAHLDYETDQMAEFVAETAQGMYDLYQSRICLADIDILRSVNPRVSVTPAFRRYVFQVLSSTRLPSSTILLGLYYLAARMSMLSTGGFPPENGTIHHLLTTALLLGSKFLDDNTFQNRSWSEVSNIPVNELNILEIEWLVAIGWELHVDPQDHQGFALWRKHWQGWQAKRFEMSLDTHKLGPLDFNVQRLHQLPKLQCNTLSVNSSTDVEIANGQTESSYHTIPYWGSTKYDPWSAVQAKTEYSPPSAPETGPTTPKFYGGLFDSEYGHLSQLATGNVMQPFLHSLYPSFQRMAYSTPYRQPWLTKRWNGHPIACHCIDCLPSPDRYLIGSGYRLQSVFG
ncbi:MAG: hypothetical protein Q9219_004546 [cf. Caloplaca sp. 3 TL-2023]